MSNEKNTFADNSRVESTSFLMEKLLFSLKLFSGHFYGQSFIETVRGPFDLVNTYFCLDVGHTYDGIDVTALMSDTLSA